MKKIFTFFTAVLLTASVFLPQQTSAQSPEKMSYQAVIRNSSDALITNTNVGMQISILQGSASGTVVYSETQTPTTNANGLVSIEISEGTIVTGTFSGIDWSAGPYFIKTETDPTGGTNYTITGTNQLLSVPYAFYSKSSANGFASVYSETDTRPVLYENGNIGIGTPSNWAKLNVNGKTVIEPGQNTWGSSISIDASLLENGISYQLTSTGGDAVEGQGKLVVAGYGVGNIMVMDSNLNVGIGTDNPVSKLDVNGAINVNSNKITNVADPENNNDAANKAYVDATGGGIESETDPIYTGSQAANITAGDITNLGNLSGVNTGDQDGSETKVTAGTNVTVTGSGTTGSPYVINATGGSTFAIGDNYQGGIIFWLDATGQHGLIAATADQSTGIQWYNDSYTTTNAVRNGVYAGQYNTERIITNQGTGSYAAQLCANYQGGNYGDWYLPSIYELNLMYLQKATIGGFGSSYYWSSTEYGNVYAWAQYFDSGGQVGNGKIGTGYVRAVRAF